MKRIAFFLLLVCLTGRIPAYSIVPQTVQQPFDSIEELSAVDFTKPLAPNQEAWVDQTSVYLLTVGPGDPLYAWFGHSALIVAQPSGTQIMYDWGIFDPDQEHFYLNFARGRMYYYVVASEATWRVEEALMEKRDVTLVELSFPKEAKFALIAFLQRNIQTEYSTYLYHFYYDNCATRIRDIINAATNGQFQTWAQAQQEDDTLRTLVGYHMIHSPALFWVLDFLQGRTIDEPMNRYEELFLPQKLHDTVVDFTYPDGTKLANSIEVLQDTSELGLRFTVEEDGRTFVWAYALAGTTLSLLLVLLGKWKPRVRTLVLSLLCLTLAVLGTLLAFMMCFSDMDMTYYNENLLFVHPLLLIPAFRFLTGKKQHSALLKSGALVMVILLLLKFLIPSLALQDNMRTIALLLPLYLSGSSFQRRTKRK